MIGLPFSQTPAQKLLASLDVIEEIVFFACINKDDLGPPVIIHSLSLTCKHLASVCSISTNPALFNRLFTSSFRISPQRFVTHGCNTINFIRLFWTVLKKFRLLIQEDQDHHHPSSTDLQVSNDDWTFVSNFISRISLQDDRAFRQLILYAHIDKSSRNLLLNALHRPCGRTDKTTWLVLGIWWATHLFSMLFLNNIYSTRRNLTFSHLEISTNEFSHDRVLVKAFEALAFSPERFSPKTYFHPYLKLLEVTDKSIDGPFTRASSLLPILCMMRLSCPGHGYCPCRKQGPRMLIDQATDASRRLLERFITGATSDRALFLSGLWLGRLLVSIFNSLSPSLSNLFHFSVSV
jgi:hypothetical protein